MNKIYLSNGRVIDYVAASGALEFNGKGWPWERPLAWAGLIKPELFTIVVKTLTRRERKGNLRMWKPWECVRLLPNGGAVNKVGLTNPGFDWFLHMVLPYLDLQKYRIVVSLYGTQEDLEYMAEMLSIYPQIMAIEINASCPNTGHGMPSSDDVIRAVRAVKFKSNLPVIVKVSVTQDYLAIAEGLRGIAEAIALNSIPWEVVFPGEKSPLWKLEKRVGGGGGGVSGKPAQERNWKAVHELALQGILPVIAPSIMAFEDLQIVRRLGAATVSFGTLFLCKPWMPTSIVERDMSCKG